MFAAKCPMSRHWLLHRGRNAVSRLCIELREAPWRLLNSVFLKSIALRYSKLHSLTRASIWQTLPIDITTRIWDNYLLVGESFMIRATLGLLKWLQPRFMEAPFEDICVLLTQLHTQCFGHVEEDELFAAIASIKISQGEFILVLKSESAKLQARQDVLQIAPNTHLKER